MEECYEMYFRLLGISWGLVIRFWIDVVGGVIVVIIVSCTQVLILFCLCLYFLQKGDEMVFKDFVDFFLGWVWEDVWQIDLFRAVDEEGWEYCVEFIMGGYGSVEKRYYLCRRRRWVRIRKLVEDVKQKKYKVRVLSLKFEKIDLEYR